MIRREDFSSLNDELQEIFMESSENSISDMVGFSLFGTRETELYNYVLQLLHGSKGIKRVADGEDFPRVNNQEGDQITFTQRHYGVDVPVTKEDRKFDRYQKVYDLVESITEEAWNGLDQTMADVLSYGWDTSYTDYWGDAVASIGPDSAALFSQTHSNAATSETYDNIITDGVNTNPALSRAAIVKMISVGKKFKDANKLVRPVRYDTLIVPPSLEDEAYRIVMSDKLAGSADNDTNQWLKQRIKRIVVWERLETTGQAADRAAYWYLADSKLLAKSLRILFSERPNLDAPEEVYSNKNWDWTLDFFYTLGFGYANALAGSKGDNS